VRYNSLCTGLGIVYLAVVVWLVICIGRAPNGREIPYCGFYLTDEDGQPLRKGEKR